jgi:hypothetical protein
VFAVFAAAGGGKASDACDAIALAGTARSLVASLGAASGIGDRC